MLKCLRLSSDPVNLELKRDPKIKDHVRKYLANQNNLHYQQHQQIHQDNNISYSHIPTPLSPVINTNSNIPHRGHRISSSDSSAACRKTSRIPVNNSRIPSLSAPQSPQTLKPRYQSHIPTANGSVPQKKQQHTPPRFEAYMMTGDLILNLSRTPQSSGLLPATQIKKSTVDSLRDSPVRNNLKRKNGTAPRAIYDTSPSESSSPSISELGSYESAGDYRKCSNNSDNDSRRASKLSKMHLANSDSLDEEEEQLIMEPTDDDEGTNNPSLLMVSRDERKTKNYNLGCANNTSSSSSASSPTNTNSTNSSDNRHQNNNNKNHNNKNNNSNNIVNDCGSYDGGGSNNSKKVEHVEDGDEKVNNKKYAVLHNDEDGGQGQHFHQHQRTLEPRNVTSSASMSSTTTTSSASTTINRSETLLTPTLDVSHSMPASPTSLSTPLLDAPGKRRELNSVPTSPECSNNQQEIIVVRRNSSNTQQQQNGVSSSSSYRKCDVGVGSFRTSRSEDHLQHSQRDGAMGNAIPIDIDEDINSSLNTLLDTRHDSEDSQVRHNSPHFIFSFVCFIAYKKYEKNCYALASIIIKTNFPSLSLFLSLVRSLARS